MVQLRSFTKNDINILNKQYTHMTIDAIEKMICDWDKKIYDGKYFEMFAITDNNTVVGSISLYQHTSIAIGAGMEIYFEYRQKGYATIGLQLALKKAVDLGYKIAVAQVRKNNDASIALHKKSGFEIDFDFINRKGNECHYFIKAL